MKTSTTTTLSLTSFTQILNDNSSFFPTLNILFNPSSTPDYMTFLSTHEDLYLTNLTTQDIKDIILNHLSFEDPSQLSELLLSQLLHIFNTSYNTHQQTYIDNNGGAY